MVRKKASGRRHRVSSEATQKADALGNAKPSTLEPHPLANIFPPIEGEEFDELIRDIRVHGLREPVWIYEGKVLDGRNRVRACRAAGVEPEVRHFSGSHAEAEAFVISANIYRRHLLAAQKREIIASLLKASPEKSNRRIAGTAKVDPKTVSSVRTELEGRGEIPHVEERKDSKGRKQPSHKLPARSAWTKPMKESEPGEDSAPVRQSEPGEDSAPVRQSESKKPRFKKDRSITYETIVRTIDSIIKAAREQGEALEVAVARRLVDFGDELAKRALALQGFAPDADEEEES
jgi:hypothetical protein